MRLKRLRALMQKKGLGTLLISHPANRRYLSGFRAEDAQIGETSGILLISQTEAILATDPRYAELARAEAQDWKIYIYHQNFFDEITDILKKMPPPLGFEALHLSYAQYQRLQQALEKKNISMKILATENMIEEMRKVKDEVEINTLREAVKLTERVYEALKGILRPEITEKEVAWQIETIIKHDLQAELSFPPIVASGENAAIPHAVPTDKKIALHEPIIVDCGVKWQGYCADMTRTFYLGKPDEKFKTISNLVLTAQQKAIGAIKAGLKTYEVDAVARSFLKEKGYAKAFLHALGHGVGLMVHESPSLSPRQPGEILQPHMIVTAEPGLYFSGWGGVRIEDMVLIKENGCERLTSRKAELKDWIL
ncbi:MAG: Xaa-Pro peptidase family protein [Candidatus Desulfofervidaceae bacterium]|nr:Xaa-Pro peptidase family protein [Candidatus Desulfofervidaceae bacterium]